MKRDIIIPTIKLSQGLLIAPGHDQDHTLLCNDNTPFSCYNNKYSPNHKP